MGKNWHDTCISFQVADEKQPESGVNEMSEDELNFLQVVSLVTSRMGCTIDSVDMDGRNISIYCPKGKQQEIECAAAIGNIMEDKLDPHAMWARCDS